MRAFTMAKWIPTKERMPDYYEWVLVTLKGYLKPYVACRVRGKDFWYDANIKSLRGEVIAWMPLPEVYEE